MNVILIVSDTFRYDHLGYSGNAQVLTPNLDKFAGTSLFFKNAYTASFPTVPNRLDLATGHFSFIYRQWQPLPKDEVVLSEMLDEKGYTTMLIADTPHILEDGYNFDRGFTGWEWIRGQETDRLSTDPAKVDFPCDPDKLRNPEVIARHLRNISHRQSESDCFVAQTMLRAIKWLERNHKQENFFLWVDTFDPHEPWDPPKWYVEKYDPNYEGEEIVYPIYGKCDYLSEKELNHIRALYSGEVTLVDKWIGTLLRKIEDLGLFDNTMIIFTSDHGFYFGEHGYIGKSVISGSYFEYLPLYEEVAHIPLIIWVPGLNKAKTVDAFVQPPDITATILDFAGIQKRDEIQGKSLLPVIEGTSKKLRDFTISSPSLLGGSLGAPRITIRQGEWLFVLPPSKFEDGVVEETKAVDGISRKLMAGKELRVIHESIEPELYNLFQDKTQQNNIFVKNKAMAESFRSQIINWLVEHGIKEEILRFWI